MHIGDHPHQKTLNFCFSAINFSIDGTMTGRARMTDCRQTDTKIGGNESGKRFERMSLSCMGPIPFGEYHPIFLGIVHHVIDQNILKPPVI
jgi:hypothetical protein